MAPYDLPVAQAADAIRTGRLTSVALTTSALERIHAHDGGLHAFTSIWPADALAAAGRADREISSGLDRGPLHGIPYGLKDLCDVAAEPTSCNSHVRSGHIASEDSEVAARMRQAGAVLVGKLTLHEFGTGGSGEGAPYRPAENPWDRRRVTGGSSSGCGVAVAARYLRVTVGTDSGGSLRLPGAYCGAVGLKPSYGLVSRRGLAPLSASLDHVGPLTRTVEEAAAVLQVLAGHDPGDPSSLRRRVPDYLAPGPHGVAGLRVGIDDEHMGVAAILEPSVTDALATAENALRDGGAKIVPVKLPALAAFRPVGMAIMLAEAFAVHSGALASRRGDYGPETAKRFLLGAAVTSADEERARTLADELRMAVDAVFEHCDVVLTATTPGGAGVVGAFGGMMSTPNRIPLLPFNLTGHPAMHVPTGLDLSGMPVGVQLVADMFDELTLLRAGSAVERGSGWLDVKLPALD